MGMLVNFIYLLEVLMCVISLLILISKNPIHSVLYLVLLFCNGAALLMVFGVEFLSIIYVIIYVGAIAILFLFIVMMLNIKVIEEQKIKAYLPIGVFVGIILLFEFYVIRVGFVGKNFSSLMNPLEESGIVIGSFLYRDWLVALNSGSNLELLGELLYVYSFVVIFLCAIVLLVAMLGAIVLTMVEQVGLKRQDIYVQQLREIKLRD